MIDRIGGELTMLCDECGDLFEDSFPSSEFHGLVSAAKAAGWTVRPDDQGGWWHGCKDCGGSTETPLERARRLLG